MSGDNGGGVYEVRFFYEMCLGEEMVSGMSGKRKDWGGGPIFEGVIG